MSTFEDLIGAAQPGPVMRTSLVSVSGKGNLRITYNWLYSALNCDPTDDSPFEWVIAKLDATHVSLSPAGGYNGMTLYASVRDDLGWTLEVQAPFSAHWITRVGRDEIMTLESRDLLTVSLLGFNDRYVAVDPAITSHDGHSGYELHSTGTDDPRSRMWFLGASELLQDGLDMPLAADLRARDVASALAASGLDAAPGAVTPILSSLSHGASRALAGHRPVARPREKEHPMAETYTVAPGAIADPTMPEGPAFALSNSQWLAVQAYVIDALALPVNEPEFRSSLGKGAPADLSPFLELIACYADINGHCKTWQTTTFPTTVALANAVYDYGANKAPVYYPPILKLAERLVANPDDGQAKEGLKAVLESLETDASDYASQAAAAAEEVKLFAEQTAADKTVLVGPKGDAGLVKHYRDEYGQSSKAVEELTREIEAQQLILKGANEEYEHDVIVAATTPTYAWVFPAGLIAAAVVAGVYGDRAVKALERAKAAQRKIDELEATQAANANLMVAIDSASAGMKTIVDSLGEALPVIELMRGQWSAMASDLGRIRELIERDIAKALPIIMDLGVDEAMRAWWNVAQLAQAFRLHAYVTEVGGASMQAWKVENHIASTSARHLELVA